MRKVNIAIYSQSIPLTSVFTHASYVWQECFYLTKGNLEVHLDKNHYDIHATCIARLPNITLQTRLSGDMIDLSIMQTRMSA